MKPKLKPCGFCEHVVPPKGQCNKCGFIDGLDRMPTDEEFEAARKVNEQHSYDHYQSIDLLL